MMTIHGSYKSYAVAYILSLLLVLASYICVTEHLFSGTLLTVFVVAFGILQILVQLILFLHLGIESKPRWNFITFLFMLMVTAIIFIGSMWIMVNLDYRMMP